MGLNSLEILSKLSNIVQITVLVLVFIIAVLQTSKFFLDRKINQIKETVNKEKFLQIENRPNFDQKMWSMLTGIQASIFKKYHQALDSYDQKDYENTAKTIQAVIEEYEKVKSWDLKNYDAKQHKEKVCDFYLLSSKANMHLMRHELAYKSAQKANKINSTHYTLYTLSAAAYNIKKYHESLNNIDKAIATKPEGSEPDISIYEEIKKRCLEHLSISNKNK
jgi:tetratricopeptide (TPR) repeat protein